MELVLYFVFLAAGIAIGGVLAHLLTRGETNALRAVSTERAGQLARMEQKLAEKESQIQRMASQLSGAAATAAAQAEKLRLLEETQSRLDSTFEDVAARALKSNSKSFLDSMTPLLESLGRFEENRSKGFATLETMVESLREAHAQVGQQTSRLAHALKSSSVRGRWGEMQLQNVVKLAGMEKHCDFDEQVSVDAADGRLRPDMVVHLPDGRDIVVDSKAPLAAYLAAQESSDDAERELLLTAHAGHVRDRVKELGAKEYWDLFPTSPDFVVMFLPDESCFSAALRIDRELIEFGVRNRVLIATPTTLIALLKSAAYGWRHQELAANAQQIANLGRSLYGRLLTFTNHMNRVRDGLEKAATSYNAAVGSLERNVLTSARRFQDLVAATGDEIPEANPIETPLRTLTAGRQEEI
ncbi:MAG TPA: DNA recombination protein RmuC [Bryobacteraceae bacterium]|nr:DNA recombination protein RmuC [Bryobacteraceae bacterium]